MRVLGWQLGDGPPVAMADGGGPVEVVAGAAMLDALVAALGGPASSGPGAPMQPTAAGVAVAVEIDGSPRWATPREPARSAGLALCVDLSGPVGPGTGLSALQQSERIARLVDRVGTWRRALNEGCDGSMGLQQLGTNLAHVERRIDRQRTDLVRGQTMLADDIAVTLDQLAAAQAEERRLSEELAALSARPTSAGPGAGIADDRVAMDAVQEARARLREAEEATEAADNTVEVLRWGLEGAAAARRSWLRWIQPASLAVASALVLVAVVLLTRGVNGAGIIVAALALVSAVVALVLPARPLAVGSDVERMRLRLARAEDDRLRWADAARGRSAHLAACAAAAGLPAAFDDAVVRRREAELAAGLDAAEAIAAREHLRQVARNTMSAAQERVGSLRAHEEDLQRQVDELGQHDATTPEELQQERRGLLEEINRRRWELDRLTVAEWLLCSAATDQNGVAPAEAAIPAARLPAARRLVADMATSARSSADGPLPVLVRGLETWPGGAERADLTRLLTELSRSTQILILTPAVERPTGPAIRVLVTPTE